MSEVKSAKELSRYILVGLYPDEQDVMDCAELIQSDRCAIIEKCKEAVERIKPEVGDGLGSDTRRALGFVYDEAIRALDSVLSEIEKDK